MGEIIVLADVVNNVLKESTREVVTAALALGSSPIVIVPGTSPDDAANGVANYTGVGSVIALQGDCFATYDSAAWCEAIASVSPSGHLLTSATSIGKELAARLAASRNASIIQDVMSINGDSVIHPIYSGKAHETLALNGPSVLTIRSNVFSPSENGGSASISNVNCSSDLRTTLKEMVAKANERLDVAEADIIISGGRGMGSPENFDKLYDVAKILGAAVGASRAAVDTWEEIPHSMQVGQTGKTVNPSLYIAVGISGAIQHLAGMRTSKYIVAINKDGTAPIFRHADYGIIATWEEALPILEQELGALLG
jgi:electron transfer flavoprotein alpha subunit